MCTCIDGAPRLSVRRRVVYVHSNQDPECDTFWQFHVHTQPDPQSNNHTNKQSQRNSRHNPQWQFDSDTDVHFQHNTQHKAYC